jgi:hypothetical protein
MTNTPELINYNKIMNDINIDFKIENEYNDQTLTIIIQQINDIKKTILKFINDIETKNNTYNLRKKIVSNCNNTCAKSNLINSYILYQDKLLEYYTRLAYLKSNCIKNYDYLVDVYNDTKNQFNLLNIEHNNLKIMYDKLNENYIQKENKLNNLGIEQSLKLDALNSELSDVKIQRDFLKGLNQKNKQFIINYEHQLQNKISELEELNIENINSHNQILNYAYEIEKILNHKKYVIDTNEKLGQELNQLKKNFEKTNNQLNEQTSSIVKLQLEKDKLKKYIFKQNLEKDKNLCEMKQLLQNKQNEKIKIIEQLNEILPNYTWNDNYGFISNEYDIIT